MKSTAFENLYNALDTSKSKENLQIPTTWVNRKPDNATPNLRETPDPRVTGQNALNLNQKNAKSSKEMKTGSVSQSESSAKSSDKNMSKDMNELKKQVVNNSQSSSYQQTSTSSRKLQSSVSPSTPTPVNSETSNSKEHPQNSSAVKNSTKSSLLNMVKKNRKKSVHDKSQFNASSVDDLIQGIIEETSNKIIVVGVGGGGSNAVNRLERTGVNKAIVVAANTDAYHLFEMKTKKKLPIGLQLTNGNGAGNDPLIGEAAALESQEDIEKIVSGADLVFVATGLGGGTGTGAAPIIAKIARDTGALVVGVCTLPFSMEGDVRIKNAFEGLRKLYDSCDTVIVIPNEKLLELAPEMSIDYAFEVVDEVLIRAVRGIIALVSKQGFVNVDFADIRQVLKKGGTSVIGLGESKPDDTSENRVETALQESLAYNLLEARITECQAALIFITGGENLSLNEINRCIKNISDEIGHQAEIIWGTNVDPGLGNVVQVTTILSGVESPYTVGMGRKDMHPEKVEDQAIVNSIWSQE